MTGDVLGIVLLLVACALILGGMYLALRGPDVDPLEPLPFNVEDSRDDGTFPFNTVRSTHYEWSPGKARRRAANKRARAARRVTRAHR